MSETKSSEKLSFVLYDKFSSPRYFELNKNTFRFLIFGLPFMTIIAFACLTVGGVYFKQLKELAKRREPEVISQLREAKNSLEAKLQETTSLNKTLQNKLANTSSDQSVFPGLSLFKQVPGQLNNSNNPPLILESDIVKSDDQTISISFNLVNQTKDGSKLAGYVFISMLHGGRMFFYPEDIVDTSDMQIKFNKGEYFATSRFRPVEATFKKVGNSSATLFKILIFSRTGDLLFRKLISKEIQ